MQSAVSDSIHGSTRSCMLHNQPHCHLPLQRILDPVRLIRSSHRNLVGATLLSVSTSLSNMRRPILRLPVLLANEVCLDSKSWTTSGSQTIWQHGRVSGSTVYAPGCAFCISTIATASSQRACCSSALRRGLVGSEFVPPFQLSFALRMLAGAL